MGIVAKQTIKGSIWSYLGVVIGFITTTYLYTQYLTTETVGLFGLLIAISTITSSLSSLGMNGVTARLFPYFRDKSKGHNGFLFVALIPQMLGFILFLIFFLFYRHTLIENNIEKSSLFAEYVNFLVPITFFFLLFNALEIYLKLLYNAVFGTFLQEFLQRALIFLAVLLFAVGLISFQQLIIAYTIAVSVKAIVLIVYLWGKGELKLFPVKGFITPGLRKEMIDVALFSVVGSLGSMIVFNIDKIVVNQLLDLSNTGVYTIAFYFGTLVIIPSRPLLKITGTLIADAWKKQDIAYIADIYGKSCINQFIIAAFLFGGIWVNIENILVILGPDYAEGKWVIFFVGLGYLVDMATGANAQIIAYSKHYRVALWFLLILIIMVLVTMYSLIPVWGITGAAVSLALSFLMNNLMRFLYLYGKFGMQPFTYRFFIVVFAFILAYVVAFYFPKMALIYDILVKGTIFTIVFFIMVVGFRVSADINITIFNIIRKFKKSFKT